MTAALEVAPAGSTRRYEFKLPIRTEAALDLFVRRAWGVRIPRRRVCPEHVAPWRAFADGYFARNSLAPGPPVPSSMAVWKASRGLGGKTFLLSTLALTEAVTLKADVNLLGGSGEQSKRVHEAQQRLWAWGTAPRYLLLTEPSGQITRLTWGNQVKALMASQASVRGPHPQRLRLDEVDEMKRAIFDAAQGQTMARLDPVTRQIRLAAHTVMSSTHQYPDGVMTHVIREAGRRAWPFYEWCYRECLMPHGWLHPSEVERKRGEVPDAMWQAEYEGQEPSVEGRAFVLETIEAMFDPEVGQYTGAVGEYLEIEAPAPPVYWCRGCAWTSEAEADAVAHQRLRERGVTHRVEGPDRIAQYSTGADWAKDKDYTVIVTLRTDVRPMRLVAFERRQREPWPMMIERFDARVARYGGNADHDATGLGSVVHDLQQAGAEGFKFQGLKRRDMLSNYVRAVERGEIVSPRIAVMYQEHKYARTGDLWQGAHSAFHLPDTIAAAALAWRAAGRAGYGVTL